MISLIILDPYNICQIIYMLLTDCPVPAFCELYSCDTHSSSVCTKCVYSTDVGAKAYHLENGECDRMAYWLLMIEF